MDSPFPLKSVGFVVLLKITFKIEAERLNWIGWQRSCYFNCTDIVLHHLKGFLMPTSIRLSPNECDGKRARVCVCGVSFMPVFDRQLVINEVWFEGTTVLAQFYGIWLTRRNSLYEIFKGDSRAISPTDIANFFCLLALLILDR